MSVKPLQAQSPDGSRRSGCTGQAVVASPALKSSIRGALVQLPPKSGRDAVERPDCQLSGSDHTASSLPPGSVKWNLRPPGKAKIGLTTSPPAASTVWSVASRSSL